MSTDILRRVFHILTEPVPYTTVSVSGRNNEARAHVAMWTRLRYSVDLRIQSYTLPVPLKHGKLAAKYRWTYTRTVYSGACASACLLRHFDEKLFDEVLAVIRDAAETLVVELPVASSDVVQRVLVVAAGERRQAAQPAHSLSLIHISEPTRPY